MKFDCGCAPCGSQRTNGSIPSFCAFANLARNVPARFMSLVSDRQEFTGPFERNFHIGPHSRTKTVHDDHDTPFTRLSLVPMQRVTMVSSSNAKPAGPHLSSSECTFGSCTSRAFDQKSSAGRPIPIGFHKVYLVSCRAGCGSHHATISIAR
jgi:hypothetical protein